MKIIIIIIAIILGLISPVQGISGEVKVKLEGKTFNGWVDDKGGINILNKYGKMRMFGRVNRMGGISINDLITDDIYEGRINPMGNAILISPNGSILRIQVER